MFGVATVLLALLCVSRADWASYKREFNKTYPPDEDARRQRIYEESLREMTEHNILYERKLTTWRQGLTVFSDMTVEERSRFAGARTDTRKLFMKRKHFGSGFYQAFQAPASIDWRDSKCITTPKNQDGSGGCANSCWAFATTGLLEYHYCMQHRTLKSFSEKYLVNCAGNRNCKAGDVDKALDHVIATKEIPSEESYPYTTHYEECREPGSDTFNMSDLVGYDRLQGDEELLRAVAFQGPVAVYMLTGGTKLTAFRTTNDDDIFSDDFCDQAGPRVIDHAVLVVGYGSNVNGKYWLVKNSWGTDWGQKGYFKISRDRANHCHISDYLFVPKYK
ncbi:cathepsin L1 [Galendromus occidentalis]|uniref:Cathepsin L1 n=1 Tax=Galendromus occidentalis TaxID=34638 RepID=A0AAJ6VVW7_9ACAR|nr:cathepsin L1 [Galendromus occidentalis]